MQQLLQLSVQLRVLLKVLEEEEEEEAGEEGVEVVVKEKKVMDVTKHLTSHSHRSACRSSA